MFDAGFALVALLLGVLEGGVGSYFCRGLDRDCFVDTVSVVPVRWHSLNPARIVKWLTIKLSRPFSVVSVFTITFFSPR